VKTNLRKISELGEEDFLEHPVWTWAEEDDESLVQPILNYAPLPENYDALFIAARLTLANGRFLNGTVSVRCSDQKVYLIEVTIGEVTLDLPLVDRSGFASGIRQLTEATKLTKEEILPIHYETDVHFAGELPVSGEIFP